VRRHEPRQAGKLGNPKNVIRHQILKDGEGIMISKLVLLLILSGSIGAGPAGLKGQETAAPVGTHVISGTVLDDRSGDPVSGAGVRVVVDGRTVGRARTGEAGGFSIEGQFEAGVGVVRTVAVGFLPETHQVQLGCDSSGEERSVCRKVVDLYLQSTDRLFDRSAAECSLVGTVFSGHGAALANAVVSLDPAPPWRLRTPSFVTKSLCFSGSDPGRSSGPLTECSGSGSAGIADTGLGETADQGSDSVRFCAPFPCP
jgi:hypothetical protein